MAPDIAHPDDAPTNASGRIALGLLLVFGACAALIAVFYRVALWLNAHHASFGTRMGAIIVYAVLIFGVVIAWRRSKTAQLCMVHTEAAKRYRRRTMICAFAYVAGLLLAITAYRQLHWTGPLAYAAALLPALPLSGMFVAMGFYLREETDEFQRQVVVESSLWATGGILVLCAGWGFMDMFGLVPHVEAWVLAPVWAVFHGVASLFIRRRYR